MRGSSCRCTTKTRAASQKNEVGQVTEAVLRRTCTWRRPTCTVPLKVDVGTGSDWDQYTSFVAAIPWVYHGEWREFLDCAPAGVPSLRNDELHVQVGKR